MAGQLIECVPNFSEGRDEATVNAIHQAIASVDGVEVLRTEMDPDHHRSVITFAGVPSAVAEGALQGIAMAVERIDLRRHSGVHPRIGAVDVVPFVPLKGVSMDDCALLARRTGEEVWRRLGVPVYFYESAAVSRERMPLENVRRGGFEKPNLAPDLGGPALHPSAGACVIGARKLLIAFNVMLKTSDLGAASAIARKIRASSGGLPALKAIGVALPSRHVVQVAMNLVDFEQTRLDEVMGAIQNEAAALGVELGATQIVGLVPKKAIQEAAAHDAQWNMFDRGLILENRLEIAGL